MKINVDIPWKWILKPKKKLKNKNVKGLGRY